MSQINFHTADWSAPNKVKAFTSCRSGGVSLGRYQSLNLGGHVADEASLVNQNRQLLQQELNIPNQPHWLKQVHGVDVIELSAQTASSIQIADGAITSNVGVVCAVLTADCLPLFLSNRAGDRVALLHAGWRGMAKGIIEQGVQAMNCLPDDVIAWAGPCIGPDSFEVGPEVREQLGGSDKAYKPSEREGKLYADLYQLTRERLSAIGVDGYSRSAACTFRDQDDFFSYRRDGECGRMASLIWIEA